MIQLVVFCLVALGLSSPAFAADAQITAQAVLSSARLGQGESALLRVEVSIPEGWHLISMDPGTGPQPLRMDWKQGAGLAWNGPWHGELPEEKMDRGFARLIKSYEQPTVHFERSVQALTAAPSTLAIRAQICTDRQCIPQRQDILVSYAWAAESTGVSPPPLSLPELSVAGASTASSPGAPRGGIAAELKSARKEGILVFMAMAFLFGLGALATPCVFPAIPLTVSFFSKYSEESFGRGARLAFVYASTMVAAFTFLGVMLSVIFGVTGVQQFAAHPIFNLVLGVVLVYFSLNLLGLFELSAPAFLLNAVNRLESDYGDTPGASVAKKGGLRDYLVVAIAAVSATTVFFTCTVAFVGLVLVAAANGDWFWPTIGMLSFASAFALPFFLLALFPQAAKRLQGKAGSWLSATRVTLGFLELAAATKFLSNSDLIWGLNLLSRNFVLTLWVPLFFLCGLFLLGKLQIGEETTAGPDGQTGVVQMLSALVMFGISLTLGLGLLHNRPFGGWVDGWLPPIDASVVTLSSSSSEKSDALKWVYSLKDARKKAAEDNRLVFVNYTGFTCTNCRYMEGGVFPEPRIASLLQKMVLVELYTDSGSPDNDANREDQVARFQTAALPLYSVETAGGEILGSFPSSTNDIEEFEAFLREAMAQAETAAVRNAPLPSKGSAEAAAANDSGVVLKTTGLFNSQPVIGAPSGKWTLLNFWATWCSPCREELEAFLVKEGTAFEKRGGAFRLIAVEEQDNLGAAQDYVRSLGLADSFALRVSGDPTPDEVDPRLGFSGTLPFTALISPEGEIAWTHTNALTRKQLEEGLARASLR